ncbi:MAG: DUF58 domain-containing protein [Bacteroidetes bacterium]|nr:DUF58 domain-containing protein [Bacteroidota bacterium]
MIPKELFKKIRQIEIRTKGLVNNVFGGEYHSRFKGQGIEFAEVRPYQVGDDVRSIDWNVSARMGDPYVKLYDEEREQTVMLAVDISGSENFGSATKLKREIAAEICAIVAFSAIKNSDKVGLLLFSDQIELFVPPGKGRRHVLRLIRDLYAHQPRSTGTNIAAAINHLHRVLSRRSIVMIASDFMDTDFEKPLRALSQKHDTVVVHLIDPREETLPNVGLIELTDAESGETVVVDTGSRRVREALADEADRKQRELTARFRKNQIDRLVVRTDESYLEPLVDFFRVRSKA